MIVLGYDPGAVHTGWAILEMFGTRPVFVDGGVCNENDKSPDALPLTGPMRRDYIELVTVETVQGYAHGERAHAKSKHLIMSAHVAGTIIGFARAKHLETMEVPAVTWRSSLLSNPQASDAQVKAMVVARVKGLPRHHNVHMRDAIGVALYACDTKHIESLIKKRSVVKPA